MFTFEEITVMKMNKKTDDKRLDIISNLQNLKQNAEIHDDILELINTCINKLSKMSDKEFAQVSFDTDLL